MTYRSGCAVRFPSSSRRSRPSRRLARHPARLPPGVERSRQGTAKNYRRHRAGANARCCWQDPGRSMTGCTPAQTDRLPCGGYAAVSIEAAASATRATWAAIALRITSVAMGLAATPHCRVDARGSVSTPLAYRRHQQGAVPGAHPDTGKLVHQVPRGDAMRVEIRGHALRACPKWSGTRQSESPANRTVTSVAPGS